jgi:hypothetical protein
MFVPTTSVHYAAACLEEGCEGRLPLCCILVMGFCTAEMQLQKAAGTAYIRAPLGECNVHDRVPGNDNHHLELHEGVAAVWLPCSRPPGNPQGREELCNLHC